MWDEHKPTKPESKPKSEGAGVDTGEALRSILDFNFNTQWAATGTRI